MTLRLSNGNVTWVGALELEALDDEPGLYSWHLTPRFPGETAAAQSLYSAGTLSGTLNANLGRVYDGKFSVRALTTEVRDEAWDAIAFFSEYSSPPIYIGQSATLRTRLTTHATALRRELYSINVDFSDDHRGLVTSDTDQESAQFAVRLAKAMRARGLGSLNSLRIRVYTGNCFHEKSLRLNAERWLNRTYVPIFGRN